MIEIKSAKIEGLGGKRISLLFVFSLIFSIWLMPINFAQAQSPVRLAVVELAEDPNRENTANFAWAECSQAIASMRESRVRERETAKRETRPVIEDISNESEGDGVSQPFFYQRIKPFYPEQAELAGITATVELEVVFGADGRVGDIDVIRWAGSICDCRRSYVTIQTCGARRKETDNPSASEV